MQYILIITLLSAACQKNIELPPAQKDAKPAAVDTVSVPPATSLVDTTQAAPVDTDSIIPLPRQEGTPIVINGTLFIVKKK